MTKTAAKLTPTECGWLDRLVQNDIAACRECLEIEQSTALRALADLRIANKETLREKFRTLGGLK